MRFLIAIVVETTDGNAADDILSDTVSDIDCMDNQSVIHACVRELEERRTCPECEESL